MNTNFKWLLTDLIIYSEDVSDVNTNVYRVNVIGKRQVELVVVLGETEVLVGQLRRPVLLLLVLTDEVVSSKA